MQPLCGFACPQQTPVPTCSAAPSSVLAASTPAMQHAMLEPDLGCANLCLLAVAVCCQVHGHVGHHHAHQPGGGPGRLLQGHGVQDPADSPKRGEANAAPGLCCWLAASLACVDTSLLTQHMVAVQLQGHTPTGSRCLQHGCCCASFNCRNDGMP